MELQIDAMKYYKNVSSLLYHPPVYCILEMGTRDRNYVDFTRDSRTKL